MIQRNNYKLKNKYFKAIFIQVKVVGRRIAISFTGLPLYVESLNQGRLRIIFCLFVKLKIQWELLQKHLEIDR